MPLFYFHVRCAGELIEDNEGIELPNLASAEEEARSSARDLLAEFLKRGDDLSNYAFEIADQTGRVLFTYPFRQVLKQD